MAVKLLEVAVSNQPCWLMEMSTIRWHLVRSRDNKADEGCTAQWLFKVRLMSEQEAEKLTVALVIV